MVCKFLHDDQLCVSALLRKTICLLSHKMGFSLSHYAIRNWVCDLWSSAQLSRFHMGAIDCRVWLLRHLFRRCCCDGPHNPARKEALIPGSFRCHFWHCIRCWPAYWRSIHYSRHLALVYVLISPFVALAISFWVTKRMLL